MARSKQEAISNIRKKLENYVLLRCEINNPFIEKYIDETAIAIVDEIFEAIEDYQKDFMRELSNTVRRGLI